MLEFQIALHSFQQVQEFVSICSVQSFPVFVGNEDEKIDGTDLMGMFSLDYSMPLRVYSDCPLDDYLFFRSNVSKFIV